MKRFVLFLSVMLTAIVAHAGNIKVTDGSTSFLKETATANIVFDWTDAEFDYKKPLKDHWKDEYNSHIKVGQQKFISGFSDASKRVKLAAADSATDYVITVKVLNVDNFFSATSFVPGHKHKIWCTITVTESATGNKVCQIDVKEYKGGRDFSLFDSFTGMMESLGKELAKLK